MKIAERVANLGIFGTDADRLVKTSTDRAWSHCELGGNAELIAINPEIFVREAIQNLGLGCFREVNELNGVQKTVFERRYR